jgi:hypothetical protein
MDPRRLLAALPIAALLALRAGPAGAQETGAEPLPAPAPTVHRARLGLVIAGGATFQVSWGLALLTGITAFAGCIDSDPGCPRGPELFMIPIAGPLIVASGHYEGVPSSWAPVLVGWGLVQAAGAAMLLVGLAGHDVPASPRVPPPPRISLAPLLSPQARGLALGVTW